MSDAFDWQGNGRYLKWGGCVLAFVMQWLASYFQPSENYFMMTDSAFYWANAQSLIAEGRISDPFFPMGSSILMAPFVLMGLQPYSLVLWVHPMLHALSCWFAYGIINRDSSAKAAFVGTCCIACYLPALNYYRQLISEPWFVCGLFASLYCLFHRKFFMAGLLAGLFVLIRSPGLGVASCMTVFLIHRRSSLGSVLRFSSGLLLVIFAGVGLVSRSTGKLTFLTTGTSMSRSIASVLGGYVYLPEDKRPESYLGYAATDPDRFLMERFYAFVNIVSPWPFDDNRSAIKKLAIVAWDLPILVISVLAACKLVRSGTRDERWILILPALGLIMFHTVFFAHNRYRMPYFPFLMCYVFAVFGGGSRSSVAGRMPLSAGHRMSDL